MPSAESHSGVWSEEAQRGCCLLSFCCTIRPEMPSLGMCSVGLPVPPMGLRELCHVQKVFIGSTERVLVANFRLGTGR